MRASPRFRSIPCPRRSTYVRTRACDTVDVERDDRSGAGEPRAADRLRRRWPSRREPVGASSIVRVSSTTSASGRAYAFATALPRLVRHEPADPDAADGDAEGDRCRSRGWRRRRRGSAARWAEARASSAEARSSAPASPFRRPQSRPARTRRRSREARRRRGALRRWCEPTLSRFQCRHEHRREYARIVRHDRVHAGSVDAREIVGVVDRPGDDGRAPRVRRANARARDDRVVDDDRARSRVREQRAYHGRRDAAQRAEPDASRGRAATLVRDPEDAPRDRDSGANVAVRLGDRARRARGSSELTKVLPARPSRRTAATTSRSRRVSLRSRWTPDLGRLFDEEAQRLVERRRLGRPSRRASARRRARRSGRARTSNSTRSTPTSTAARNELSVFSGASVAAPRCPIRSGRPSRRSSEITASASSAGSPPRAGRPRRRTRRSSGR